MNEREMLDRAMGLIREQLEQGGPFSLLRFRMGELLVDYEDAPREPQPTPNLVTREELAGLFTDIAAVLVDVPPGPEDDGENMRRCVSISCAAARLMKGLDARGEGE